MTDKLAQLLTTNIIKNKERINWDQYFMSMAILSSVRSSCRRLNVGCVLVKDKHVISMGYNGFLPNADHVSIVINNHEQGTVHAEQNAISDAASRGVSVKNSTAYITHYPCINCFKILAASGIKEIKYLEDYKNDSTINKIIQTGVNINISKINIT
jgi:dCMP deaminase